MTERTITWRELWSETTIAVASGDVERPLAGHGEDRRIARWLCETASGADGSEFDDILDEPATERTVHTLDAMVARVRAGEPLQYVLGRWGFRHLDLMVDRRVLIPRPETEQVVEVALRIVARVALTRRPRGDRRPRHRERRDRPLARARAADRLRTRCG